MKNMFGFGTDDVKRRLNLDRNITGEELFIILINNFPFVKRALDIDSGINDVNNFLSVIHKMSLTELLDTAIDACEPYLVPEDTNISYSYPTGENNDNNYWQTELLWNDTEKLFHLIPISKFYQSLKLWLIMSALYSESLCNVQSKTRDILKPLNLSETDCDLIEKYLVNNWNKGDKRVNTIINNNNGKPFDSYYDIMIVNGLLSSQFHRDGSIDTKNTRRDETKDKNRLPKHIAPDFAWHKEEIKCDINYDSQKLDFKLITQYLIERLTCVNFAHYRNMVKVFTHELPEYYPELNDCLPETVKDALVFYPLVHFRLHLLESTMIKNENTDNYSAPTNGDWEKLADGLKYQIFVYFPLVETIFHTLLGVKYKTTAKYEDLASELANIYKTEPLYLKGDKSFSYDNRELIISKDVEVVLSDGTKVNVTYNKKGYSGSKRKELKNVVLIMNWNNPSFISCIKTSFGTDYERIKDIPERVFADYVKKIMEIRGGFPAPELYSNREHQLFIGDFIMCRSLVFKDYMDKVKDIDIDKFNVFVNEVIIKFDRQEFEYLFQYDCTNGFIPVYWIQKAKDQELFGVDSEELDEEAAIISVKVITLYYNYCKNCLHNPVMYNLELFMNQLNERLEDVKELLRRNNQYFKKVCSLLNLVKTKSKLALNKDNKNRLDSIVKEYKGSKSATGKYDKFIKESIDNIDILTKRFDELKINIKELNNGKELYKLTDIFRELVINYFDNSIVRKYYNDHFIEWYLADADNDISKDFFFTDLDNSGEQIRRLINAKNSLINLDSHFHNLILSCLDFDYKNLSKGDMAVNRELNKLKDPVNNDILKIVNQLNSFDMKNLMNAIIYYSYLNSHHLRLFNSLTSCITDLPTSSEETLNVDYRKAENYSKFCVLINEENEIFINSKAKEWTST